MMLGLLGANAAAGVTYATWNPADKGSGVTLSGGNLTCARSSGSTYESVRANIALSGKRYWEASGTWIGGGEVGAVGLAGTGLVLSSTTDFVGKNATDCGVWGPASTVYKSNALLHNAADSATPVYRFAFDSATGKLWIGTVSAGWFTGDPATDTSPITTMAAGTYYPAFTGSDASAFTANFGATAFAGTVPSGYTGGVS